ncbi:MAG: S9 family peptidase [Candidatus Eisenbacteria bacterium]|nr:S9 family peptidase [Candidatus Eisenbacteria bacterium]
MATASRTRKGARRAPAQRLLDPEILWQLPRVGAPTPAPDGQRAVVPVTTYVRETNLGTTRLWLVTPAGRGEKKPRVEPLTRGDTSSVSPVFHPDGGCILLLRRPGAASGAKFENELQLHRLDLNGGEPERLTDLPFGVIDPQWFPDGRHVAFLSTVYLDAPELDETAKKKAASATNPVQARVTEDRVYRYWDHWLTDGTGLHLFILDTHTGAICDLTPKSNLMFDPDDPTGQFRIAPDGREIAFCATKSRPPHNPWLFGLYTVKVPARVSAQTRPSPYRAIRVPGKGHESTPAYSPDGRYLFYLKQLQFDFYADRARIVAYDRKSRVHTLLAEEWDRSPSSLVFDRESGRLYLTADDEGATSCFTFDWERALERPGKVAPKHLVGGMAMAGMKVSAGRLFFALSSLSTPPEAFCMDARARQLERLTEFTAGIMATVQLGATEDVSFIGAEGDTVQMYLVYPPGEPIISERSRRAKKLPLVHLIHGGPHGAFGNEWFWRWNAQTFAAQGYVVALVNFHGSTGWGQDFCASILGRWGDQPYVDIMRATDWLVDSGLVDEKRMAATGGSYGGYLSAWIASQTNRFRCIVNHAGVSDLQTQYASDVTQGRSRSMGGEPWDRIEGVDRWNSLRFAEGFRSPMLLLHGVRDFRVPYGHALETYNVYKAKGRPARLVVFPDENHWILKMRNSLLWYGEVFNWLERWLKPKAQRTGRGR